MIYVTHLTLNYEPLDRKDKKKPFSSTTPYNYQFENSEDMEREREALKGEHHKKGYKVSVNFGYTEK
jgi:hypothetical protein